MSKLRIPIPIAALLLLLALSGPGDAFARSMPSREALLQGLPDYPALSTLETAPGTPPGTPIEWWALRENLPQAWSVTHGEGALVAVIDSGVDATQPDLAGKIAYTNDIDGEPGEGSATVDRIGHGTAVAGIACAAGEDGTGMVGAGYDCRLLIEKSDLTEGSEVQAIVDATNHGAQAINMSFGTEGSAPASPQLREAIEYAYRHNVVMVAAAADQPITEQGVPANVLQPPGTGSLLGSGLGLTVASVDYSNHRSAFSGYGSEISLAAYGAFHSKASEGGPPGIFSTFPANPTAIELGTRDPATPPCGYCRTTFDGDDSYAYLAGTSMAAPQVAGVAALIRQVAPGLSAAQVIRLLESTARRAPGSGWNPDVGWGILDGGAAVAGALVLSHEPRPRARPARRRYSPRSSRCLPARRNRPAGRSSSGRCRT
jgi:serine protease